jgi:hypothetical protein
MNAAPPALRTLAFGQLDRTVWGAGWISDPGGSALAALGGDGDRTVVASLRLSAEQDGDGWRLDGDGATLVVSPAGEVVDVHAPDDGIEGCGQLCRVGGRFELGGTEQAIDCLGVMSWWSGAIDLERFESIRAVATWFEPDEALAVTAFRARKARGHDSDVVAAAVIGPESSGPVEDPRLSTTYEAGGWPVRAGVELWLGGGEDSERLYPRRASGEATGARAQAALGGLEFRAEPFRWHSRGRDGAGIYILARRR